MPLHDELSQQSGDVPRTQSPRSIDRITALRGKSPSPSGVDEDRLGAFSSVDGTHNRASITARVPASMAEAKGARIYAQEAQPPMYECWASSRWPD